MSSVIKADGFQMCTNSPKLSKAALERIFSPSPTELKLQKTKLNIRLAELQQNFKSQPQRTLVGKVRKLVGINGILKLGRRMCGRTTEAENFESWGSQVFTSPEEAVSLPSANVLRPSPSEIALSTFD